MKMTCGFLFSRNIVQESLSFQTIYFLTGGKSCSDCVELLLCDSSKQFWVCSSCFYSSLKGYSKKLKDLVFSEAIEFCSDGDKIIINSGIYRETLQISKSIDIIGVPDPTFQYFVKRNQAMLDLVKNDQSKTETETDESLSPWDSPPKPQSIPRFFTKTREYSSRLFNDVIIQPPFNNGRSPIVLSGSVALKVSQNS
jgi:hypothetical protein